MLAMNRLRSAYLRIAPALQPYFSTSPHDDERGLTASYLSFHARGLRPWGRFVSNTATVIATVDAALAAAIAVLAVRKAGAATTVAVAVGAVAFLAVWTALFLLQRHSLSPLRRSTPRFPTPPDESLSSPGRPYLRRHIVGKGSHDQRADHLRPPAPAPSRIKRSARSRGRREHESLRRLVTSGRTALYPVQPLGGHPGCRRRSGLRLLACTNGYRSGLRTSGYRYCIAGKSGSLPRPPGVRSRTFQIGQPVLLPAAKFTRCARTTPFQAGS
jgi:hypothetical protein